MSIKEELEKIKAEKDAKIEIIRANVEAEKEIIILQWQLQNQQAPQQQVPQPQYYTQSNVPFTQLPEVSPNQIDQSNKKYGAKK